MTSKRLVALLLILLFSPRAGRSDEKPLVNLLRLGSAEMDKSAVEAQTLENPGALADDDPKTFARDKGNLLEVVYGFHRATVTAERVAVTLPPDAAQGTLRVEILASVLSPKAGFVSIRSDPLKTTTDRQEFSFAPTAARWLMLRFSAEDDARSISVAEVSVLGRDGPPASHYAFKDSPAEAFDVLARLKTISELNVSISPDEAAMFADVREGRFNKWSSDEAALLASGITDRTARRAYLSRLGQLEKGARAAIAGARTPFEKGERLLAWLHAEKGPLSRGYVLHQTDLSTVLDTGTFNCVSSATLYNVLGRRLGLDLRAIEVPDHAFSVLYDGTKHADVETTTAQGFNPSRDEAAREKLRDVTGFRYIPDSHRDQRREIGEVGLVAITYYNHGVTLTNEKRHLEALLSYFRAMSLDRESDSAVKNALASLANWSVELAKAGKYRAALDVLAAGLELAPQDATLDNNHRVVWREWAEATSKAGNDDEAIAILKDAAKAIPKGDFANVQAWLFIRRGEDEIKQNHWEKAIAVAEPGLKKVDETPRADLRKWLSDVPLRWGQAEIEAKHYAEAIDVLEAARKQDPEDARLTQNLVYTVQEWVREVNDREGEEEAVAILSAQIKRFPGVAGLKDVSSSYIHRRVNSLVQAGEYQQAAESIVRNADLFEKKEDAEKLVVSIDDRRADRFASEKKWGEAVAVYEEALSRLPDNEHLKNNLVYMMQEWTKNVFAESGREKARDVFLDLMKRFPKVPELEKLARSHVQKVVTDLCQERKFSEALDAIDDDARLLTGKDARAELDVYAYDLWAEDYRKKEDWQEAVDLYARAAKTYPDNSHLKNNAISVWNEWATKSIEKKDWQAAIKIYREALERYPDDSTLKNNLGYCEQQASR